jgi:DNA-binding transcriptional regulator YiaG
MEMVAKIVKFVTVDDESLDSAVFEGTAPEQSRTPRDRTDSSTKPSLVRVASSRQRVGLTQREVAVLLRVSERAVRNIERRAIKKLFADPGLRQAWQDYLNGNLEEDGLALTPEEAEALLGLVRTLEEWLVVRKVLRAILR